MPLYDVSPGVPPGYELDYVQITGNVTVSGSEGTPTSVIDGNPVTLNGSTRIKIEFFSAVMSVVSGSAMGVNIWDGGTDIGRQLLSEALSLDLSMYGARFLTPSSGTHTYHIKAWKSGSNGTIFAGAGGAATYVPAWYRVTAA